MKYLRRKVVNLTDGLDTCTDPSGDHNSDITVKAFTYGGSVAM